ncbi:MULTISPECIES: glycosyltransferase family 4 protein [Providencia]|uniref:glycosyltransferase family 4 protein n=1 Tax=Providencia TaxID=586 RepID=UPI00234A0C30|nr:glycosyltransferase family 4 protein [Providencia sp. PROV110]
MKALLINTSFHPNFGGVENSFRSISEALSLKEWDVDIIASDNFKLPSTDFKYGARILRYKQRKFGLSFLEIKKLLKNLNVESYDLIISRSALTSLALCSVKIHNFNFIVPGVYKYQNTPTPSFLKKLKYSMHCYIEKQSFKKSHHIFVFSKSMKSQIQTIIKNKNINMVEPGVDIQRFSPASDEEQDQFRGKYNIPKNKKVILCIGRFVKIKNFQTMLSAMPYISEDFILVLVGDGDELQSYKDIIFKNQLSDRVFIFEKTAKPEQFYKLSDFFCLPSTYEPFGQVLLEATCSGLPIIALDQSIKNIDTATNDIYTGYPELVTYIPQNTPESFAAIFNNISSTKKTISASCIEFSKKHSWDSLISKLQFNNKSNFTDI